MFTVLNTFVLVSFVVGLILWIHYFSWVKFIHNVYILYAICDEDGECTCIATNKGTFYPHPLTNKRNLAKSAGNFALHQREAILITNYFNRVMCIGVKE